MPEQLSRKQVELILRRTAELERGAAGERGELDSFTAEDLERVAADLGMSREALGQALAESRAGLLTPEQERTLVDRFFGSRVIEARRFLPGDVAWVRAAIERFFAEQGFQIKRNRGDVQLWEASRDFWAKLRRAFRAGAYRLPRDVEIEVRIAEVPGGPHPVLVQLSADAVAMRGSRVAGAATAAVIGAAAMIGGAIAAPSLPLELVAAAGGGAVGLGGTFAARSSFRNARAHLQVALERFLDFLEHEPARAAGSPAAARDPITRLVEFLSGDWWR